MRYQLLCSLIVVFFFLHSCTSAAPTVTQTPFTPAVPPTSATSTAGYFTLPVETPTAVRPYPGLEVIEPANIQHLEVLSELGTGRTYDVADSPATEKVAVYTPHKIFVYDAWTLAEQGSIDVHPNGGEKETLAYSPDGKILAFSEEQSVHLWNLSTWSEERRFFSDIPYWGISEIQFSPDGQQILVTTKGGSDRCDGEGINFALYNLHGDLLFDRYYCTAYSENYSRFQDGRLYLVFSSIMTNVFPIERYVVDLDTGILLASSIKVPEGYSKDYSETVVGSSELLPSNEDIRSWTPEGREEEAGELLNPNCELNEKNTAEHYQAIYTRGEKGLYANLLFSEIVGLSVWNLQRCRIEKELTYPSANEMLFQPAGDLLATNNGMDATVWDLRTGAIRFVVRGIPLKSPVDLMAFNTGGNRLITGTLGREWMNSGLYPDYAISIWDTADGTKLREIKPDSKFLQAILPTPDQNIIMLRDTAGFSFWNIADGTLISRIPAGVYTFEPSGSGIWVAVRPQENREIITLFDYKTGATRLAIITTGATINDLSVSEDGSKLLVHSSRWQEAKANILAVYDRKTKEKLWTKETEPPVDGYIDLGPEYLYYASFENGESLLPTEPEPFWVAFPGRIAAYTGEMTISHEGKKFQFWDTKSGNYVGDLYSYIGMDEIAFSPDKHHLATVGANGLVYIWGVQTDRQ